MLNTRGITQNEVQKNNRFDVGLFKSRVIDVTPQGERIDPKCLGRLAQALGAKGKCDELVKKIQFSFNSGDSRLKRRRGNNGYVYEKIGE